MNIFLEDFKKLTWDDLIARAGKKVVFDGRKFQQRGHVKELSLIKNEGLLAWVKSEEIFASKVIYDGVEITSECTCNQLDQLCAHAIAVIIEYILCLKKNVSVPYTKSNDQRLFLL